MANQVLTPCVEYRGAKDRDGYGVVSVAGRTLRAHRHAYVSVCGPIPLGLVVMHVCDNPACINIFHLRLGTVAENNADRHAKGRDAAVVGWNGPHLQGESHSQAKLTEVQVAEIRARIRRGGQSQRSLAREFGVSPATVTMIKQRKYWKAVA